MAKGRTYAEGDRFYAIVSLPDIPEYYVGPFCSRSAAYRFSVRANANYKRGNL